MGQELFKPIEGYEGYYDISNHGRIYSQRNNIYLKPYVTGHGYLSIGLRKKGKKKTFWIHRLVAIHFIENKNELAEINHKDFNRQNNYFENLEWINHGDNIRYSYEGGNRTGARGERSPNAKHTNDSILEIRSLYKTGNYTQQQLADMFNDKRNNITKIIQLKRWQHI